MGRRPVCILTRDPAIEVLSAIVCAPITRTIRGIPSEVEVGAAEGLPVDCAISCDNLLTVPLADLDPSPVGHVGVARRVELDRAVRYALDLRF